VELEKLRLSDVGRVYNCVTLCYIMGKTRIQVDEKTREQLKKLGSKGESYDDVIQNLLNEAHFPSILEVEEK